MIIHNYEEAKAGLMAGEFVLGPRQCGKTLALMDLVAERHSGNATVFTLDMVTAESFLARFIERHPKVNEPTVLSSRCGLRRGIAFTTPIGEWGPLYADLFDRFLPGDRNRLRNHLTAAIRGV